MRYKRIEDIKDLRNLTWEERMLYDEAIKVYRDNLVTEAYAKEEGYKQGYKEAYEQVYKEAYEQSYKDGFEEGRMEVRNEVACKMKAHGLSAEMIARVTGLTPEEVRELQA